MSGEAQGQALSLSLFPVPIPFLGVLFNQRAGGDAVFGLEVDQADPLGGAPGFADLRRVGADDFSLPSHTRGLAGGG